MFCKVVKILFLHPTNSQLAANPEIAMRVLQNGRGVIGKKPITSADEGQLVMVHSQDSLASCTGPDDAIRIFGNGPCPPLCEFIFWPKAGERVALTLT